MYDFQKRTTFLQKWILNLQDFQRNQSLKQSQSALFCSITHMTILSISTCVMNVGNQSIQAFVTGLGHFVIDRATLFTDHRISSRPILA